jgi:[ribosomal protein S5]-alanine N-acetyltransferase
METAFETERLIAREWNPRADISHAMEMYSDPEVMRFLGREPQVVTDEEPLIERLEKRNDEIRERNDGTGFWALETKDTGSIVGAVIVKWLPDAEGAMTSDMEIGWHLKRSEWGKGYATEAGMAAKRYALDVLREPVVYAVVYKENTRSIAVTQRLGMTPVGPTDKYYGVTLELFEARQAIPSSNES